MNTLPQEQLWHELQLLGIPHQGSDSHSWRLIVQRSGDEPLVSQRSTNASSWVRLLGVVLASLTAAYLLLLCFHFIESGHQRTPLTRALAAHRDESCESGDAPAGDGEGGGEPTTDWTQLFGRARFGDSSLLPFPQASGLQMSFGRVQQRVEADAEAGEGTSRGAVAVAPTARSPGGGLYLWENRNMPTDYGNRLLCLFDSMREASKLCISLLPALTSTQRMQVTYHVVRLIALDLGAASLVREDKESKRNAVGDALINLIERSLELGGNQESNERVRGRLSKLKELVIEIKKPRQIGEEKSAEKYRKKMISIVATAETVLSSCLGVLRGLLQLKEATSARSLPPKTVEQQLHVVKAVYIAHVDHVARDGCLRQHIVECQKRKRVYALLDREHFTVSKEMILPLKHLQQQIAEAVVNAGGLLPSRQSRTREHDSASGALEEPTGERKNQPEEQSRQSGDMLLREEFVQAVHFTFDPKTSAAHKAVKVTHSPPTGLPPWRPDGAPRQAGPVLLQPRTLSFSGRFRNPWPPVVSLQDTPSARYLHAAQPHITGYSPVESSPYSHSNQISFPMLAHLSEMQGTPRPPLLPRPPQPSGVQYAARPRHRVSSQQTYAGRSAAAPWVPPSPLPRVDVSGLSQRLQPPAPPQQEGYSLFGGGGVPPWLPFSQASPASIERRSHASDGRPQEGEGTQRGMRNGRDEAGDSLWSGGNWSGRQ
ncbi:hypothetical protein, conserved [Eimeria tenella]|uniref:Transmembrane protein n=1 Tax=Eimeria tenella TaxID=5802 RepID=U6L3Y5_EIMTE|nr:hypothetical protein, conserved [Eimeria tenella]CDJ42450.1 hypothetical protein, conserved [Eimeria tenella]|eukprot:XP_013233200.1 hypothetical protein, conserved [Eimeria tenella]